MKVSEVMFRAASAVQTEAGLLGWVAFTLHEGLRLEGVAVRRTLEGRYALSFPARETPGRRRFWVRPSNDVARLEIEAQVIAAIGLAAEVRR